MTHLSIVVSVGNKVWGGGGGVGEVVVVGGRGSVVSLCLFNISFAINEPYYSSAQ